MEFFCSERTSDWQAFVVGGEAAASRLVACWNVVRGD
jgi:hypothetical protein